MEKTLERLVIKKKKEDKILKFSENKVVHVDSIVYTTFSGHYVTIYLKDETINQVRCTQKNFEKQIEHFPTAHILHLRESPLIWHRWIILKVTDLK